MSQLLRDLVAFLRDNRHRIVHEESVLEAHYDPTYGEQKPSSKTIEVIDFDRLCEEIDRFNDELEKEANK